MRITTTPLPEPWRLKRRFFDPRGPTFLHEGRMIHTARWLGGAVGLHAA
jgi:hypothetical protein